MLSVSHLVSDSNPTYAISCQPFGKEYVLLVWFIFLFQ